MNGHPSPQSIAAIGTRGRLVPSDGPIGDADLDRALTQLRASVDHLVGGPSGNRADGGEAGTDAHPNVDPVDDRADVIPAPRPGHDDAGDVVTRAHEAQEILQARLREAQA